MIESVEVKCHSYEQNQSFELKKMIRRDDGTSGGGGQVHEPSVYRRFLLFYRRPSFLGGGVPFISRPGGGRALAVTLHFPNKTKEPNTEL